MVPSNSTRPKRKLVECILLKLFSVGIDRSSIKLVGQSLAGQIVGLIGTSYYNVTGQKLGQVTALDPSGICYDFLDNSEKITSSDAEFVDIWRTDIDGFGYYRQVGIEPVGTYVTIISLFIFFN